MQEELDIARSILLDREKGTRLLVTEYRDRLYAVALALCRNPAEAEDLAFRTIERAVSKIELYEERDSFYEWLQIILLNLYRNSVRGKMVRSTVAAGVGQDLENISGKMQEGDVESAEKVYAAVDSAILRDAINRLPEDMKEAVILRYFMDMPMKKMAQILSVPVGTVMSRLHYARLALAQRIGAAMKKPAVAMIAAALVLLGATAAVVVGGRLSSTAGTSSSDEATTAQERPESTEGTETTATAAEADSPTVPSVPKVPLVSSTSTSSTDKQPTFSNSQSENKQGATKMKNQIRTALITAAVTLASVPSAVLGAPEYTIPAPNGVGDVVALTNTLATMETDGASYGLKLWLEPGIYDLRGIKMESGSHLYVRHVRDAVIAGLGSKPEDTVLLGGGENDKCRVAYVTGGGNYWTTTISNLTITGGYADSASRNGCGGGIHAGNSSVLYDTCIISNNVSMASATANGTRNYGGGGCYLGRARNCLFASNRTTGSGGGLSTAHRNGANQTLLMASVVDCVFTNNQSSGDVLYDNMEWCRVLRGRRCCMRTVRFYRDRTESVGNSASSRGGAICVDGGSCEVFGCTFVENASTGKEGGALYGRAAVTNCTFVGNRATDGGAIFATLSSQEGDIVNCHFYGNVGSNNGGAIRSKKDTPHVRVFCSDFSRNTAFWGQAAYCADLFDCVVTNHESTIYVLYDCNLMRCRIRNNKVTTFSAALDYSSSIGGCTNVNCEFAFNTSASAAKVSANKTNINCTYADNALPNANYSHITRSCPSYNCIFTRNTINGNACDVRAHDMDGDCALVMTNCLFNEGDSYVRIDANGTANNEGLANCRQVANMKFVDGGYVPTYRSPAYNAGMASDWILDAIGDGDLAGLPRIFGDGLDIGAYECQMLPPGFLFSIR